MSRWKLLLIAAACILVGLIGYRSYTGGADTSRRGGSGDADKPVPVTVVSVTSEDVALNLDALGTVQALNSVIVSPQVGGKIQAIPFREGQQVRKGDIIAVIDQRGFQAQLDQVLAKKQQDQAQLGAARSTLKRYQELIQKNFVAAQDLENQRHSVAQFEALLAADDAAIASARLQLDYATIRAPIDGLSGIRKVDVGNIVQGGQTEGIVVLTQVQPINVVFTLPEQNLDLLRRGAAEALKVSARDRSDDHLVAEGVLSVIDNQIDSTTGTLKLKAEFANVDNALWPGQFVNVRVQVDMLANALTVPSQALQRGPDGSYVYLVQDDSSVIMQPVKTGTEAPGGKTLILDGLRAGQRIVTEGQFLLKPGVKVLALAPGEVPLPATTGDAAKTPPTETDKPRRRRRDS